MFAKAVSPSFTRGFGFFSFCEAFYVVPENLLVIACCYALAFKGDCFETSSYLGGVHSEYKVLHGFKTLFLKDGTQNQFKKTHSRGAVRLAVNLS